jgi:hypothetical protein
MLGEITKGLKETDPAKPVAKPEVDPKAKAAAAADPKAKATPKGLTAADLAPPQGLDPKSAQRFQKLATGYSELEKQHKEVASRFETLESDRAQFADRQVRGRHAHPRPATRRLGQGDG